MKRHEGLFVTGGLVAAFILGGGVGNTPITTTFEGEVTGAMESHAPDHTTDVIVTDDNGRRMSFDVEDTSLNQLRDGMAIGTYIKATFKETAFDFAYRWVFRSPVVVEAGKDKKPDQFIIIHAPATEPSPKL